LEFEDESVGSTYHRCIHDAHHRQVCAHSRDSFRDEQLLTGGNKRNAYSAELGDLARPGAGRIDNYRRMY